MKREILLALAIGYWATPGWADIDYHCLTTCINGGDTSTVCMPKCTYGKQSGSLTDAPATAKKPTSKEFTPLVPDYGKVVVPAPVVGQSAPSKDYTCIYQCVQGGSQYQLCEKQCTPLPQTTLVPQTGVIPNN